MTILNEGTPGKPTSVSEIASKIMERIEKKGEEFYKTNCCLCGVVFQPQDYDRFNGFESICPACKLRKIDAEQKRKDIYRLNGLKAYEQFTLKNYTNKEAIDLCSGFPDLNLFIWGPAGTGKTHLATAIIRNYETGIVYRPQEIARQFRGKLDSDEEEKKIRTFINEPYLVIDDLGVEKKTEYSFSILYEILDGRDMAYNNGMIITSNLSLTGLSERLGDDRITSRIAGMCKIIQLSGKDFRLQGKI